MSNITRVKQFRSGAPLQPLFFGGAGATPAGSAGAAAPGTPRPQQEDVEPKPRSAPRIPPGDAPRFTAPLPQPLSALSKPLPANVHLLSFMPAPAVSVAAARRVAAAGGSGSGSGGNNGSDSNSTSYLLVRLVCSWASGSATSLLKCSSARGVLPLADGRGGLALNGLMPLPCPQEHIFETEGSFAFDPELSVNASACPSASGDPPLFAAKLAAMRLAALLLSFRPLLCSN